MRVSPWFSLAKCLHHSLLSMASQHLDLSPTKKSKTKHSKRRLEDDIDNLQPSCPKKNKRDSQVVGNTAPNEEPHRSSRTGAGMGGQVAQLEKVANVLEERPAW